VDCEWDLELVTSNGAYKYSIPFPLAVPLHRTQKFLKNEKANETQLKVTMAPTTQKQWSVKGKENRFDELKFEEGEIPAVGDNDVLVKLHGASLNYRDLVIPQGYVSFSLKYIKEQG
jgi:hypothetical protein